MLRILLVVLLLPFAGCLDSLDESPGPPAPYEPTPDVVAPNKTNDTIAPGAVDPEDPRLQNDTTVQPWVWPDIDDATIRPGVQISSSRGQCTSNFVFLDPNNTTVYLGFAAHCVANGDSMDTNGCTDPVNPLPLGTKVDVQGGGKATLVYSSWVTMAANNEADSTLCPVNDFAVVQLSDEDAKRAHPAMLTFGGPTGVARSENLGFGDKVLTYGNTGLRPGPSQLDAREGFVSSGGAWSLRIYALTPGLPGDSGSGVLTGEGAGVGILVTVSATGSNGVTSLYHALNYAETEGDLPLVLATWDLLDGGILP